MITAIVFVQAQTDRIPEIAQEIADLDGVSDVYSVTGEIDLIVVVRATEFDRVADIISDTINKVPGVLDTTTHLAFRAFSKRDTEAGFALGL